MPAPPSYPPHRDPPREELSSRGGAHRIVAPLTTGRPTAGHSHTWCVRAPSVITAKGTQPPAATDPRDGVRTSGTSSLLLFFRHVQTLERCPRRQRGTWRHLGVRDDRLADGQHRRARAWRIARREGVGGAREALNHLQPLDKSDVGISGRISVNSGSRRRDTCGEGRRQSGQGSREGVVRVASRVSRQTCCGYLKRAKVARAILLTVCGLVEKVVVA